jgi:acetyltransferase-like isoleucine patch superfamily enzyme
MPYLSKRQLHKIEFKYLGNEVLISNFVSLHKPELMSIGDRSRVDDFSALSGNVEIGKNVHIAVHNSITASKEAALLDDFSGLAMGCHLFTSSDDYSGVTLTNPTVSNEFKSIEHGVIHLERHVIVGAGSVVFPGVHLAEGCSFGAFSLINKSTSAWGIYRGIPAKRVGDRSMDLLKLETEYLDSI